MSKSSRLVQFENELAERQNDVATCDEMLGFAPDDNDARETKAMLQEQIAELNAQIALEKTKQSAAPPPPPPSGDDAPSPQSAPKYDMSKHPKFQKGSSGAPPPPDDDTPQAQQTVFKINDLVLAKYSDDKQWYQATVITKTGSSTDPVYTVKFKGYGNTETKRKHEIRAVHTENKKRKADGSPAVPAPPPAPASPNPVSNSTIISAAPSVDPSLVQKREPSKVSDGPTRMAPEPKKLKGNKALEKSKSSWNDWQKSGPKKAALTAPKKKDSQFRTPDLPNAKVGFTGSGKPMSKDQTRAKWNYGREEE